MHDVAPTSQFNFILSDAGGTSKGQFQEVSGLGTNFDLPDNPEGGENRFAHKLPQRTKPSALVLKRGTLSKGGSLARWMVNTLEGDLASPIQPRDLNVALMNETGQPVSSWTITNAYPQKYSALPSQSGEHLAIETLELAYATLERAT